MKDEPPYKYKVYLLDKDKNKIKTVHFGRSGYSDFTKLSLANAKDAENRKKRYIERHAARENFKDILTAGFWSRWLLWNEKTILASRIDIEKKFNVKFI